MFINNSEFQKLIEAIPLIPFVIDWDIDEGKAVIGELEFECSEYLLYISAILEVSRTKSFCCYSDSPHEIIVKDPSICVTSIYACLFDENCEEIIFTIEQFEALTKAIHKNILSRF